MTARGGFVAGLLVAVVSTTAAGFVYIRTTGLSALSAPSALEAALARRIRRAAVPADVRALVNPVPDTSEGLADGLAHFADHCAVCHGVDGGGDVAVGKGLFPPAPDMRRPATQTMTDGELFWVIEHGVRFTGMPGWATGTDDGVRASWQLVRVLRHLPRLTADERRLMEGMMPQSPEVIRQQIEEEQFLQGGTGQ